MESSLFPVCTETASSYLIVAHEFDTFSGSLLSSVLLDFYDLLFAVSTHIFISALRNVN